MTQITSLERRTVRGGRDSIDHAPGAHDDVANAVAGAVVIAFKEPSVTTLGTRLYFRKWGLRDDSHFPRRPEAQAWRRCNVRPIEGAMSDQLKMAPMGGAAISSLAALDLLLVP